MCLIDFLFLTFAVISLEKLGTIYIHIVFTLAYSLYKHSPF